MKFTKGDFLSFNTGSNRFLLGFVPYVEMGKYQIALTDYCNPVAPSADDTKDCQVFAIHYEMGEQSLSTLDVCSMEPADVDNEPGIEKISHLDFTGFLPAAGFTPISYSADALYQYFKNNLQTRNGEIKPGEPPLIAFESKRILSLNSFLSALPVPNLLPTIKLYRLHSRIQPHPGGNLTYVNADLKTPYGKISSHWRNTPDTFYLDVEVPPNTKSEIYIPYGSTNGYDHVSVGPGIYHYTIKRTKP